MKVLFKRATSVAVLLASVISCPLVPVLAQGTLSRQFDALEIIEHSNQGINVVAARETPIDSKLSFSAAYTFPRSGFERPSNISFGLYGYFDEPQWGDIEKVVFHFGKSQVGYKPIYTHRGADRDRRDDRFPESSNFESLVVPVSPQVAQTISRNGGVRISSLPKAFDVFIPASKMDRWRQVVDSVRFFERTTAQAEANAKANVSRRLTKDKTGLPLSEEWKESADARVLETTPAWVTPSFAFAANAVVTAGGRRLRPPLISVFLMGRTSSPAWQSTSSLILSFAGRRLRLGVNDRAIQQMPDGTTLNVISARIPYRDFVALAGSKSLSVEVGSGSFSVKNSNMAGVRELLRRSK